MSIPPVYSEQSAFSTTSQDECETPAPAHPENRHTQERVPRSPPTFPSHESPPRSQMFSRSPTNPTSRSDTSRSFPSPHHLTNSHKALHNVRPTHIFWMVCVFFANSLGIFRNLNFMPQTFAPPSPPPSPPQLLATPNNILLVPRFLMTCAPPAELPGMR